MGGEHKSEGIEWEQLLASTHAPAWGRTNSGEKPAGFYEASTHAPAWGRTGQGRRPGAGPARYNSRPRVGVNVKNPWHNYEQSELQLTPREGGECRAMANVSKLDNSNSLHSVGKPQRLPPGYDCNETTTHAPVRGANGTGHQYLFGVVGFNSRPRVGANQKARLPEE